MRMRSQATLHKNDVVQRGNDGEEECGAQENSSSNPYPLHRVHLQKHREKDRTDLRESVGFAEDAGTEIPQPCYREKYGAGSKNGNVPAEDKDRVFPGNLVQDRQDQEQSTQQKLVSNRIQVLSQQSLLMQSSGQQSIQSITEARDNKQKQRPTVM